MGKLLLVLIVIGLGLWFLRRGGCCGMGRRDDQTTSRDESKGCH